MLRASWSGMIRTHHFALVLAAIVGAACSATSSDETDETNDELSAVPDADGLSPRDKAELAHISQGNELFPLSILRALKVETPQGKVAFLDPNYQASTHRLLRDDSPAAHGLPVGLSVDVAADTGFVSVGINCASCHVARWEYQGAGGAQKAFTAYGAPNLFNSAAWIGAVTDALKSEWYSPAFWLRVARENERIEKELPELAAKQKKLNPDGSFDFLKDVIAWRIGLTDETKLAATYGPKRARLIAARGAYLRNLLARMKGANGAPAPHDPGPGRLDMPNALKATFLGPEGYAGARYPSSASNGSWYFLARADWFQINENVSSPMLRDIAETFVAGAAVDIFGPDATYTSSINFDNNAKIDRFLANVRPPEWPADVARNATLAQRGKDIYASTCRGCHEARQSQTGLLHFPNVSCDTIGVDCNYANSYLDAKEGTNPARELTASFQKVAQRYYEEASISPEQRAKIEDRYDERLNPSGRRRDTGKFRFTDGYRAKPLDGTWATAPFLHNGSVPTLRDLLSPAAQRPKAFYVGGRRYDLKRVGIETFPVEQGPKNGSDFLYDTTKPGNGNGGHEFGVNLSDADKDALIEFLKGLGAGQADPTFLGGPLNKAPEGTAVME